jgi:hypothetical protein
MDDGAAEGILRFLDETARNGRFPVLDNIHVYPADTRLTAYRSAEQWLLLVEVVGYAAQENEFVDHIHRLGEPLAGSGDVAEEIFVVETDGPHSIWDREEGKWLADWRDFRVLVRGREHRFRPSPGDYAEAGVEINPANVGPGSLRQDQLIRFLAHELSDQLLCTDRELRAHLPDGTVRRFLQVREWRHPDIRAGELPSDSAFFQHLARALETGRKALPPAALADPNTHWSNWPMKWYG